MGAPPLLAGRGVSVGPILSNSASDIFCDNENGPNFLFHNQGNGTFVDAAAGAGEYVWTSPGPQRSLGLGDCGFLFHPQATGVFADGAALAYEPLSLLSFPSTILDAFPPRLGLSPFI